MRYRRRLSLILIFTVLLAACRPSADTEGLPNAATVAALGEMAEIDEGRKERAGNAA